MGIRKRGKKWLVTVELGEDEKGVRRRKCLTCETEKEAVRQEAILRGEVAKGSYQAAEIVAGALVRRGFAALAWLPRSILI